MITTTPHNLIISMRFSGGLKEDIKRIKVLTLTGNYLHLTRYRHFLALLGINPH